jgi:hypothetical protein|tara:strand:+ start:174 stop:365 length:192 start_codon:yes stop_codon:yes gene_type:complete
MAQSSSNIGPDGERFLEKLPSELSRWEAFDVITAEQSQAGCLSASTPSLSRRAQGTLLDGPET